MLSKIQPISLNIFDVLNQVLIEIYLRLFFVKTNNGLRDLSQFKPHWLKKYISTLKTKMNVQKNIFPNFEFFSNWECSVICSVISLANTLNVNTTNPKYSCRILYLLKFLTYYFFYYSFTLFCFVTVLHFSF